MSQWEPYVEALPRAQSAAARSGRGMIVALRGVMTLSLGYSQEEAIESLQQLFNWGFISDCTIGFAIGRLTEKGHETAQNCARYAVSQ